MDGLLKAILTVAKKGAGDAMDGAEQVCGMWKF